MENTVSTTLSEDSGFAAAYSLPTYNIIPQRVLTPPFGMHYADWFKYRAGLSLKKSGVRSKVDRIPKNGKNQREGYSYAEAADIFQTVNKIMHDEKLGFDVTVLREWEELRSTRNGNSAPITKVELLVIWTDLETGYFEEMRVVGSGLDYGDKGVYKSYTGAAKYALVLNFLIPTGDDPENDSKERHETPQGAARGTAGADPRETEQQGRRQSAGGRTAGNSQRQSNGNKEKPSEAPKTPQETQQEEQSQQEPEQKSAPEEGAENANEPISPILLGEIKTRVLMLRGFSSESNKKKAEEGIYKSLMVKIKVNTEDPKNYTIGQAKDAMRYLDAWIEDKKQKQKDKEDAIQRQIAAREQAEAEAKKEAGEADQTEGGTKEHAE